jgi:hypothetical protein
MFFLLGILLISPSASGSVTVGFSHTHSTVAFSDELEELFVVLLMAIVALIILAATSLH